MKDFEGENISGISQRINCGKGICQSYFLMNRLPFKLNPKVECALSVKRMPDSDLCSENVQGAQGVL